MPVGRLREESESRPGPGIRRGCAMIVFWAGIWGGPLRGQDVARPDPPPPVGTNNVMRELQELRREVEETRQLKRELIELRNEMKALRGAAVPPPTSPPSVPGRPA